MSRGFTVSGGMNVSVAGTPPGVVSVARKANRVLLPGLGTNLPS